MEYAYALLDKGYIPDAVLRPTIRSLCRQRQREIDRGEFGVDSVFEDCSWRKDDLMRKRRPYEENENLIRERGLHEGKMTS